MFLAIVCGYVGLGFASSDNIPGCALFHLQFQYRYLRCEDVGIVFSIICLLNNTYLYTKI